MAQKALAAQTQLHVPVQLSWAPQSLCYPKTVSWGDPQSSSGLLGTGDRIFKCNLLKVGCVFLRSLSWRGVGIHSLQALIPTTTTKILTDFQVHRIIQAVSHLLLKALSVLPVLLGLMGSPVQSVPYLLEALGSVL